MPDTTNLDMTLTEAEKLLGVKDGYAHGDVQQAYRSIARKYHPDKWLDKPEDERKRATHIYERANVARRVLLNPSLAKPESKPEPRRTNVPSTPTGGRANAGTTTPYDNRSSRHGNGTYASTHDSTGTGAGTSHGNGGSWNGSARGRVQTPTYGRQHGVNGTTRGNGSTYDSTGSRTPYNASHGVTGTIRPEFNSPTHTYDNDNAPDNRTGTASWATVGNSEAEREKFNTAKSFADKFGQTKDPAEADYAAEYARYASSRYHKASDALHWTTSMATTLVTLAIAFVMTSQNGILQEMGDVAGASTASGMRDAATSVMGGLTPLLAVALACVVKALLYDMVVAHQLESALDRTNAFLHGIPFVIGGVAIALFGWHELGGMAFVWAMLAFIAIGVMLCVIHGVRHSGDEAEPPTE